MSTDPRSSLRDIAWLVAAVVFAAFTVRYLWDIAALILTGEGGARDVALLVAVAAVVAAGGGWLTWGAWRRVRWGHTGDDRDSRS